MCQQCHERAVSRRKRDSIFCDPCIAAMEGEMSKPPSEDAKDYWAKKDRELTGRLFS